MLTNKDIKPVESKMAQFGLDPQTVKKEAAFALAVINSSEALKKCSQESVLRSIVNAANIGLSLNPEAQECALIARRGECTLMPMYQGLANLAYKSGNVSSISTVEVRENDKYEFTPAEPTPVKHSFGFGERGKPVGYYTLIRYSDGSYQLETMSLEEVIKIRDKSDGYNYAKSKGREKNHPWFMWFSEMARKACLKRALKYVNTANVEQLQKAVSIDNSDYGAPQWKKDKALYLLQTTTYDDEQKASIEQGLKFLSSGDADELLAKLEMNQLPNHPGYNDRTGKKQIGKQVEAQVQNAKA